MDVDSQASACTSPLPIRLAVSRRINLGLNRRFKLSGHGTGHRFCTKNQMALLRLTTRFRFRRGIGWKTQGVKTMRKLFLTIALSVASIGAVLVTPSKTEARPPWAWYNSYYSSYYSAPSYSYYGSPYSYGYYGSPATTSYYYGTPYTTSYYTSGTYYTPSYYSSYYYTPSYSYGTPTSSYYYATPTYYWGTAPTGVYYRSYTPAGVYGSYYGPSSVYWP